jgi:hypothetical protein
MNTISKVLIAFSIAISANISCSPQGVTTVGYTFRIVNDFGKSLTGKQIWQADFIRDDTVRYIKIIFQDQGKTYNNGYIILNSPEKLLQFINDLELLIPKLSTEEVVTVPRASYKMDINNPENRSCFQQHLNLRVCIYEPNSTAFIGFKKDKLLLLLDELKSISW